MYFKNLQEIIAHIKKTITCPHCKTQFEPENLEVLYLQGSRLALTAHCHTCNTSATIVASEEPPKSRSIELKKNEKKEGEIGMNDILDLRAFMESHKGGFKDMF